MSLDLERMNPYADTFRKNDTDAERWAGEYTPPEEHEEPTAKIPTRTKSGNWSGRAAYRKHFVNDFSARQYIPAEINNEVELALDYALYLYSYGDWRPDFPSADEIIEARNLSAEAEAIFRQRYALNFSKAQYNTNKADSSANNGKKHKGKEIEGK